MVEASWVEAGVAVVTAAVGGIVVVVAVVEGLITICNVKHCCNFQL
jgi:hypothetical protein